MCELNARIETTCKSSASITQFSTLLQLHCFAASAIMSCVPACSSVLSLAVPYSSGRVFADTDKVRLHTKYIYQYMSVTHNLSVFLSLSLSMSPPGLSCYQIVQKLFQASFCTSSRALTFVWATALDALVTLSALVLQIY